MGGNNDFLKILKETNIWKNYPACKELTSYLYLYTMSQVCLLNMVASDRFDCNLFIFDDCSKCMMVVLVCINCWQIKFQLSPWSWVNVFPLSLASNSWNPGKNAFLITIMTIMIIMAFLTRELIWHFRSAIVHIKFSESEFQIVWPINRLKTILILSTRSWTYM